MFGLMDEEKKARDVFAKKQVFMIETEEERANYASLP
jgi:hypothetical protein